VAPPDPALAPAPAAGPVVEGPVPPPESAVAVATPGAGEGAGLYRATAWVNMRAGPGQSFERVEVVSEGQTVQVVGTVRGWRNVVLPDGRNGWVYESFLTPSQ
jgi:uncharacterized protein YgiM (DUF1202 family)